MFIRNTSYNEKGGYKQCTNFVISLGSISKKIAVMGDGLKLQ